MKIEKTEYSYQVTECDLKFGEQITLDGELLISVSVLDKIRAEIEQLRLNRALGIIDKYKTNPKDIEMQATEFLAEERECAER